VTQPNQPIALRAERDFVIVFPACPQDVLPTNGGDGQPTVRIG
jgi:uncharacterized protein YcgI (DUF1989 family)